MIYYQFLKSPFPRLNTHQTSSVSMAALNLSPSSKLPMFSNFSSQYAPFISFHSLPKPAVLFSSIILRQKTFSRNRSPRVIVSAIKKLKETELVAIPSEDSIMGILPSVTGVYAVYSGGGDIQFVGITRNLAASVLGHKKSVPELCSSVKVGVVEEPDKNSLTEAWKSWMEEHIAATGKVPVGNEPANSTWVKKSPKKKSDLRLTPGHHVRLTVPLEDLIDRLVKENKVVAFIKGSRSAALCGFSQRVVAILESQGVDYESIDVLDEEYNYGLRETLKKYSSWPTFPQIFVDGELVGGCDILTSMYEKGELSGLFK